MKILFFTLIDSSNKGYLNKIESQVIGLTKLGFDVTYTYIRNDKFALVNSTDVIEIDIPRGNQWKKRKSQYKILKNHLLSSFDVLLIRFNYFDYWIFDLLKDAKKRSIRVVCEIPTFPYRNELWNNLFLGLKSINPLKTLAAIYRLVLDLVMPHLVKKYIHRVFTYSPYKKIWGIDCIEIDNGIHIENISIVTHLVKPTLNSFNAIAVGYFQKWHAYERIIEGMRVYYSQNRNKVFKLTFVGKGPDEKKYRNMVTEYNLDKYVTFRGPLYDKDLDDEFDKSNIAISSLGGHTRKTDTPYSPLKSREYCARGIPFIYSYNDKIFDKNPEFSLKFPIGDSPIQVEQIIDFCESHDKNEIYRDMMVQFANDNFSWSKQLEVVFSNLDYEV